MPAYSASFTSQAWEAKKESAAVIRLSQADSSGAVTTECGASARGEEVLIKSIGSLTALASGLLTLNRVCNDCVTQKRSPKQPR